MPPAGRTQVVARRLAAHSATASAGLAGQDDAPAALSDAQAQLRLLGVKNVGICQLIFELTTRTPEKGYGGLFLNQAPPSRDA
jgi:hypothetical protein